MDKIIIDTPSDWYGIIMIYTSNQPIGYIVYNKGHWDFHRKLDIAVPSISCPSITDCVNKVMKLYNKCEIKLIKFL